MALVARVIAVIGLILIFVGALAPSANAASASQVSFHAILNGAHLAEPLVRTAPTTADEDAALAQALNTYERRARPDDTSSLTSFVTHYPRSGWTTAVLTNLGLSDLHDGYFSRAIEAWRQAWSLGRNATDPRARALVDRAVGELARLYASFGQFDNLATLFEDIGARPITGSATEAVQNAREELGLVTRDPRHLFNCGPIALEQLMLAENPHDARGRFLQWYRAGPKGTNLAELGRLADKAGLPYRLVLRRPGQPVPTLAIVHWKLGHFAAVVGKANGRYHVEDPAFPGSGLWVTQAALDAEASGYFLIPANATPATAGWRAVGVKEAARVWGKGPTFGTVFGNAFDALANALGGCPMCGYNIKESVVGLTLSDQPVGYTPPVGPSARVRITYNQREDSQPAIFGFFNVSPKWTLNWLTYVIDDPTNPGANVSRYLSGGGSYAYGGYSSATSRFAAQPDDGSILFLASQSPVTYRRQLADGGVEIYARSNGASSYPRDIFLSQVIDPRGNAVTLNYDSQMRLVSLTDAAGRQTTFSYGLANDPLLVTAITDPFGRRAALTYDSSGRLSSITDILGLKSSFVYDANSLVDAMTTPYGLTTFAYTAPGTSGPPRFLQITDPLGHSEREEWLEPAPIPDSDPAATVPVGMPLPLTNQYLSYRDSFHWDKNAYVVAGCTPTGGCDYTKARDLHFDHVPNTSIKSTTIESVKYPLENRIWYIYPGQSNSIFAGAYNQPIATGRVLDDGTTQLRRVSYDAAGYYNPTQTIDPLGRVTSYAYANQIDLALVSEMGANGLQTTLGQWIHNTQHLPVVQANAAYETTAFAYNPAGQLTAATNPLGQTTTNHYNSTGDLTSIVNADGATQASLTYDAFDRVATRTDSEGWTVAYAYDAADRLIATTYPDGTSETYAYQNLDLASYRDRLGRTWSYTHDADRRLTTITDPGGHRTLFGYSPVGEVTSRTDPNANVTRWAYDVEGRLTTKTYADLRTLTFIYETATSRLKSVTDALGQTKQFTYAEDDQVLDVSYLSAVNPTPNVAFAYDPYFPRRVSMTDGTGTTQYAYGPVGLPGALEVQQETAPLASIPYAYDALGRLSSRTVAGSGPETFGYDSLGRLTSHASDLGSFTLAYLGQTGQVASRQLSGALLATSWTHLPNSGDRRLSGLSTSGFSPGQSTGFSFATNAENFITGQIQTSDVAIAYPPGSLAQTASYNGLNQLTNLSGQGLMWDADGNLTSDGTRTYSWDAENRLVAIAYPGQPGKATTFAYDGL
ncbi:MAG: hypothetical protein ACREEB_16085, partial [Caulobacteraceae bacterium]